MSVRRIIASVSCALGLALWCMSPSGALCATQSGSSAAENARRRPRPAGAVAAVLAAFDRVPLVALGEAHSLQEEHDFISNLIRHPDFASKVNAIVVEFGNARYQGVLDRYVAGEPVSPGELSQVWRNSTVSPRQQWDAPVYERFFATVREVNLGLPAERRLRVLAGDPPIDWGTITKREEALWWGFRRDPHYASVVISEVLAKGHKALMIAGTMHFTRRSPQFPGAPSGVANALQIIEQHHPGTTFVIAPHIGFGDKSCDLEPRLADWDRPSIADVKGTWLGSLDPRVVFKDTFIIGPPGGPDPPNPWEGLTFGDLIDAYLYLGGSDELTLVVASPFIYRDDAYFNELNRRSVIMSGRPLDERAPQYYLYGFPSRLPPTPPPPLPPAGAQARPRPARPSAASAVVRRLQN